MKNKNPAVSNLFYLTLFSKLITAYPESLRIILLIKKIYSQLHEIFSFNKTSCEFTIDDKVSFMHLLYIF